MARYTGPKNKIARRERQDLGLKTTGSSAQATLQHRINIIPGQKSRSRFRKQKSDYGIRLREKQKAKRMYGVLEKQFRRYVRRAVAEKENTLDVLVQQLESRLDNVVYRLRLAPTRASARQLITHRHIKVNDKITSVPSYNIKIGDKIELADKAKKIPAVIESLKGGEANLPKWLTRGKVSGKIRALPGKDEINEPIDWLLIIEYYTR